MSAQRPNELGEPPHTPLREAHAATLGREQTAALLDGLAAGIRRGAVRVHGKGRELRLNLRWDLYLDLDLHQEGGGGTIELTLTWRMPGRPAS